MKKDCCSTEETEGVRVNVSVDVSKIIKYLSLAGVVIVAIIFASRCFTKFLADKE